MAKKSHSKRGSLAYTPRKRAKSQKPRIRAWPEDTSVQLLAFPGYKAGMTQVFMIDDHDESITRGQEVNVPVTILETPPVITCAIRIYGSKEGQNRAITEVWTEKLSKEMKDEVKTPKDYDQDKAMENAEKLLAEDGKDIRLLLHTQPRKSALSKKKPEILEIQIGGDSLMDKWEYAKDLLGNEIKASDVIEEGGYVDAIAVTKGKGTEGPVQRWGVKIQNRKVQQARRHVGTLGPWQPRGVMRSVPAAGQTGYHQRTDYNKRVLKISEDGNEITPDGGFLRYGLINSESIILDGSTPGTTKRLVCLRQAMRPKKGLPSKPPTITHINKSSQQGV